jgi:hypothetical protein
MTTAQHHDARTAAIVKKADAANFKLNERAQWALHNIALHADSAIVQWDDDQAALYSRSLEQVLSRVIERPRPELPLASGTELLPVTMIDDGATEYRYFLADFQGEWVYAAGMTGHDMPTASLSGAEIVGRLQLANGATSLSQEDLRNFRFGRRGNLPSMLASANLRGMLQLQDSTLAWGRESFGLYGLFNHPFMTILTAAGNGAGSTDWFDKTVDQIVTDIGALIDSVADATNQLRHVTRILMSIRMERFLKRQRITDPGVSGTGVTFWEYIQKVFVTGGSVPNGPELPRPENPVEFMWVRYMDGTNQRSEVDGVKQLPVISGNPTDSMFAYIHNDAEIVSKVETSMKPRMLPPQMQGVMVVTPGEAKWGGIETPEPVTLARMDGCFGNPAPPAP